MTVREAPAGPGENGRRAAPPVELTVIVPAYNEERSVATLLDSVVAALYEKQIVVVDDGSTDGTAAAVEAWIGRRGACGPGYRVEVVSHVVNRGKGAAIRTGVRRALGEVCLVQDADLEYDTADYPAVVGPVLAGETDVVYGSRYLAAGRRLPWTLNRACVVLLNATVRLLFGRRLTDEATCYKAFRTDDLRRMDLRCERFEFCPEVTAKACRMNLALREVPIGYAPRSLAEGKKIRWWDGVEAVATLVRWRFAAFRPTPAATEPVLTAAGRVP